MKSRLLHEVEGLQTYLLVFDAADEVIDVLSAFAREHALAGSRFTAIGAFERATLGWFDWERRDYDRIPVDEQVEVVALQGDIAIDDDGPRVHAHAVLGRRDGSALGGHLLGGRVRPTLELTLTETPSFVRRAYDARSGLNLIALPAGTGGRSR